MMITEIWTKKSDFTQTQIQEVEPKKLAQGEILVEIDKFSLTANNVSYAMSGDSLGYWHFFPIANDDALDWGKVTVWGMANIVESNCPELKKGERIYGFFPMASHVVMQPGAIKPHGFTDITPHRAALPIVYNQYNRCAGEPEHYRQIENERCLYFPLFITSFVLSDFLQDQNFFNARQIIIGSASSKTAFGLAYFLKQSADFQGELIGITSPSNMGFTQELNMYDTLHAYDEHGHLNGQKPAVFVDMSGNGDLTHALHHHYGAQMVSSIKVGATHWQDFTTHEALPGATPEFFFAPTQIEKRNKEWGPGVLFEKAYTASIELAGAIQDTIAIDFIVSAESVAAQWQALVQNEIGPKRGLMASLKKA